MSDAPMIKGSVVREFLLWYERKHGAAALFGLIEGVPSPEIKLLHPEAPALGVLASSWYPCTLVHAILDRVCGERADEGQWLAREATAEVVPRLISGVYAVIFRAAGTPTLYAMNVDRQWRRLHTTGKRRVELRGHREALSTTTEWSGHHPTLCWITIYTMVEVFRAMGYAKVSHERVECVAHGAKRCATILRW